MKVEEIVRVIIRVKKRRRKSVIGREEVYIKIELKF